MWSSCVLMHTNALVRRPVATVAVIALAFSLLGTGCGDDIEIYKPSRDEGPYLPQTSPENVLHNLAASYTLRDYHHVPPLFSEEFFFHFAQHDLGEPGVPYSGDWGRAEELEATWHMLDSGYVPQMPEYKVESIEMSLVLSGSLQEANPEGAPPGTLKGFAALDLMVRMDGGSMTFLARSRPLFYFAPDDTMQEQPVWRIWRCLDAPHDEDLGDLAPCSSRSLCGDQESRKQGPGKSGPWDEAPADPSGHAVTWGLVKAFYR